MAFISDIHANLEALESVLEAVGEVETYCLGDIVGYGASPNEVVSLIKTQGVACILGNHDQAVLSGRIGDLGSTAAVAAAWTSRILSEESRSFLAGLPQELTVPVDQGMVYMTHGSPDDRLWEYVHPATHSYLFSHYLSKLSARAIALGHTHVPFLAREEKGIVFNPGSVGQPRNGDSRASCALLTVNGEKLELQHLAVPYDIDAAAEKIRSAGLPESLGKRLFSGS
jgi:putative phosphoesterase